MRHAVPRRWTHAKQAWRGAGWERCRGWLRRRTPRTSWRERAASTSVGHRRQGSRETGRNWPTCSDEMDKDRTMTASRRISPRRAGREPRAVPLHRPRVRPQARRPASRACGPTSPKRSTGTRCSMADADGQAKIAFDLSDSVTTFRVRADAHGDGGRIGSGDGEMISRIPFSLEPKLPLEVTAGDRIDLPVAVVNDTDRRAAGRAAAGARRPGARSTASPSGSWSWPPASAAGEYFTLDVTGQKGDCELTFRGTAGNLADAVRRPLRVVPPGFPKDLSYSGQIDGDAGSGRRAARGLGARLAGGDARTSSPRRWPTCRRAWTASCASRAAASSRPRRRTTPTCCRCSTCRSTTWPTRPSPAGPRTC